MIYKSVSIESVISRVIRNLRITDTSYANDILEWINEGLDRMRVVYRLNRDYKVLNINNHSCLLPCGLVTIDAVVYNGNRLRKSTGCLDFRIEPWKVVNNDNIISYFQTDPTDPSHTNPNGNAQNYGLIRGFDLKQVSIQHISESYYTQLDYIKTSFEKGTIILFYKKRPVDDKGYPLVPDVEQAKEGLFWYVAGKLVMSGFTLPDPRMDYEYCEQKALKLFKQAKNIIKLPSVDERESELQFRVNLIPPSNYYQNFGLNGEQPKFIAN